MTNPCGTCSLCCDLLGVVEYEKAPNSHCQFCPTGSGGCQNYDNRPATCRDFECGFVTTIKHGIAFPIEFRPDRLHIILTGEIADLGVQFVNIDPRYPDAMSSENGRQFIDMLKQSPYPNICWTMGDKSDVIAKTPKLAAAIKRELVRRDQQKRLARE